MGRDLKYALRILRKNWGFTVVAVLTLAVGLGANAAIFTVVNSVLLRPLPYAAPGELFSIDGMSYTGEFLELQRNARGFDVAAYMPRQVTLTGDGPPLRAPAASVSSNFVTLLGARAMLGRPLRDGDELAVDGAVVLLSHAVWRNRFGADPAVVGRRTTIDGVSRMIIGVMPPEFAFPAVETQLWITSAIDTSDRIALWSTSRRMIGRLRSGFSIQDANLEVQTLAPSMRSLFPWRMPTDYGLQAAAVPLRDALVKNIRTTLLLLFGAVGTVLVIAAVNVSNLLLARTLARSRELAIRASLGAARGQILRHVVCEGTLVVAFGIAVGVPVAYAGVRFLAAWLPADLPRAITLALDARMLMFAALAVTGVGLIVAVLPALRASRLDLAPQLADVQRAGRSRGSRWTSNILVAAQMALAILLVVTATLLVRSLANLFAVQPGFRVEELLSARISPPAFRFAEASSRRHFYQQILDRAAAVPGVTAAAVTDRLPFAGEAFGSVFMIEGRPNPATTGEWPMADISATVSPAFFETLGIELRGGRAFTAVDSETAMRVAIVSESLAHRYWPGESPIGRRFTFPGDPAGMRTIVGVVSDVKWERLDDEASTALYVPLAQGSPGAMRLVVRANSQTEPEVTFAHVRAVVRDIDPDTPVDQMRGAGDLVAASVEQPRFAASMLSGFAFAGLLLGAIGIYGTIADDVARRRREIGVRMALGAQRADVIRTVVAGTLVVVMSGAAAGIAVATATTRVFAAMLFGVAPTDVPTFAIATAVLGFVALAAAYLPARRAAGVDPLIALRGE